MAVTFFLAAEVIIPRLVLCSYYCRESCSGVPVKYPLGIDPGCGSPEFINMLLCTEEAATGEEVLSMVNPQIPSFNKIRSIDYTTGAVLVDVPSGSGTSSNVVEVKYEMSPEKMRDCTVCQDSGGICGFDVETLVETCMCNNLNINATTASGCGGTKSLGTNNIGSIIGGIMAALVFMMMIGAWVYNSCTCWPEGNIWHLKCYLICCNCCGHSSIAESHIQMP
ncbi:OLC1v1014101C2 [Oldenlandia corymbosa var. corymbosa]|nr:OLC1v1014101C2 [Oldenlandia corymbosa var. corymbosa]